MFTYKYKITDADMKAVNKRLMWSYFIPYLVVSLLGLGAGIAATILRPRTEILVFGILLIVLASILFGCSMLLLIAPKNFVVSALLTSDDTERTVTVGESGVAISTDGQQDIKLSLGDFVRFKNYKTYLLAYLDKDRVLLVKDAEQNGKTLAELFDFLKNRTAGARSIPENAAGDKIDEKVDDAAGPANAEVAEKSQSENVENDGDVESENADDKDA